MLTEKCPRCGSSNIRRSRRKASDPDRKSLSLFVRFFRCRDCHSRFSAQDLSLIQIWGVALFSVLLVTVTVTWAVRQQPSIAEHDIKDQLQQAASTEADTTEPALDEAERNYRKGLELLRRSAQHGARSNLPDAVVWLRQAAEDGHLRAQLMLGVLYEDGSGVIQDYEQALDWYRLAASQGETVAMYRVGSMLRRGVGADKDLIKAYAWCNIAAARGHQEAAVDRDQIGSQLSPKEMKEAQQQSRTFDEELPYIVAEPFMLPAGL